MYDLIIWNNLPPNKFGVAAAPLVIAELLWPNPPNKEFEEGAELEAALLVVVVPKRLGAGVDWEAAAANKLGTDADPAVDVPEEDAPNERGPRPVLDPTLPNPELDAAFPNKEAELAGVELLPNRLGEEAGCADADEGWPKLIFPNPELELEPPNRLGAVGLLIPNKLLDWAGVADTAGWLLLSEKFPKALLLADWGVWPNAGADDAPANLSLLLYSQ